MSSHATEVAAGQRFEFGANWARFLSRLDGERIAIAETSLRRMLEVEDLGGKSFLDVGSGSGLFSLAARRLGARVHSFDFDPQSAACTRELKRRFFPDDDYWVVQEGSVLDAEYMTGLGRFDVVYAWGVLHHTGDLWKAMANTVTAVAPGGRLFVALYNDQGRTSKRWRAVKVAYNRLPRGLRWVVLAPAFVPLWGPDMVADLLRGKPFHTWRTHATRDMRGMSAGSDLVDWVGGLPFEVARPDEVLDFCRPRGFILVRMITCGGGLGCNQFVFVRQQ